MGQNVEVLKNLVPFDPNDDLPLHAQVRRVLNKLAHENFEPGDRFFSEPILIDNLGVSQGTVRRALGDLVASNILVRKPAKGTYVSTKLRGAKRMLGVFVPFYPSVLMEALLEQVSKWCVLHNRKLELFYLHRQDGKGLQILEEIHWNAHEGDIVLLNLPPTPTWQIFEKLDAQGYRTVNIGTELDGYTGNYVGIDTSAAVRVGIEHLAKLGHKRVAYLASESMEFYQVQLCCRNFLKMAPAAGFEYYPVIDCGTRIWENSFEKAYGKAHEIDWRGEGITAVYTFSDNGAFALLRYFAEQGIKVPDEISVLGYGNERSTQFVSPPMTSVDFLPHQTIMEALSLVESPLSSPKRIYIQPRMELRASTAALPAEKMASLV